MKRHLRIILLSLYLLIIQIITGGMQSLAIDWTKYTESPCRPLYVQEWSGPLEWTLCGDSLDCANDCCYTIVYYYSYDDVTGPFSYYSIEVVGIFKTGTDCDDCDKEEILAEFYEKLFMWKASQSPGDFKDSLIDPQSGLDTCIQPLWTKGECLDGQLQGCDPDLYRCCAAMQKIYFNENGLIDSVKVDFPSFPIPACTTFACNPHCNAFPYIKYPPLICSMPCNYGEWSFEQTPSFSLGFCQGQECRIYINYQFRETFCEGQTYLDYKINTFRLSEGCQYCNLPNEEYYSEVINWLLENGILGIPENNQCDTTYRTISARCWRFVPDGNFTRIEPCENDTTCCWSRWRVCNNGGNITKEVLDGSDYTTNCPPSGCVAFCWGYPTKTPTLIKGLKDIDNNLLTSFIKPNPTRNEIEIVVQGDYIGTIVLKITDIIGNEIMRTQSNKKSKSISIPFDISNISAGLYNYYITADNRTINTGKIIVE